MSDGNLHNVHIQDVLISEAHLARTVHRERQRIARLRTIDRDAQQRDANRGASTPIIRQSTVAPEAFTTFFQLSMSFSTRRVKSSGVLVQTSNPCDLTRARMSG